MATVDEIRNYIYSELPNRPSSILQDIESVGNPNDSTLPKILNAPLNTFYLQSDVTPRVLFVRTNFGTDKDWQYIGESSSEVSSKTISFQFFIVKETINKLNIRCPYNGQITKISANTNLDGAVDTELIVEKISEIDFKNKADNWTNILSSNLFIKAGEVVDDETHIIDEVDVVKNDLFRISLIGSADIKNLNVQIELDVII